METLDSLFSVLQSILSELGEYFIGSSLLIYVSLSVIGITLITYFIFGRNPQIKYIPGLIVLIIGVFNFFVVRNNITSQSSLPNLYLFVMGLVSGLIGIFFALIIGIVVKPVRGSRKNLKKTSSKIEENPVQK